MSSPPLALSRILALPCSTPSPPTFANELLDLIAHHAVPLPPSFYAPHHPYMPILFPLNPAPPTSTFMSLALVDSVLLHSVTSRSWTHVILTAPSHAHNITLRPYSAIDARIYSVTRRIDFFIPPPTPPIPDYPSLLTAFSNLTHIVWKNPPTCLFDTTTSLSLPSITHLQLAYLPCILCPAGLTALASIFSGLLSLQIMTCVASMEIDPSLTLPSQAQPLFPRLKHLAAGVPYNFMPGQPEEMNDFLKLCCCFPAAAVCPSLDHLAVQLFVSSVERFIDQHGENLKTIAFSSSNRAFFLRPQVLAIPLSLTTVIIHVDSFVHDLAFLPPLLATVVLVQPFVPDWLDIPILRFNVRQCLHQLLVTPHHYLAHVRCENRNLFSPADEADYLSQFADLNIEFSLFDFGTLLPHPAHVRVHGLCVPLLQMPLFSRRSLALYDPATSAPFPLLAARLISIPLTFF